MAMPCQGQPVPWQCFAKCGLGFGKASPRAAGALAWIAKDGRVLGSLARHCQGRPGLGQSLAKGCRALGNALSRAARDLAMHCEAWQGIAKGGLVLGKALPRTAGSLARLCQGRPGPWHCLGWQGMPHLAEAPGDLAMHCQGWPGLWQGLQPSPVAACFRQRPCRLLEVAMPDRCEEVQHPIGSPMEDAKDC